MGVEGRGTPSWTPDRAPGDEAVATLGRKTVTLNLNLPECFTFISYHAWYVPGTSTLRDGSAQLRTGRSVAWGERTRGSSRAELWRGGVRPWPLPNAFQ